MQGVQGKCSLWIVLYYIRLEIIRVIASWLIALFDRCKDGHIVRAIGLRIYIYTNCSPLHVLLMVWLLLQLLLVLWLGSSIQTDFALVWEEYYAAIHWRLLKWQRLPLVEIQTHEAVEAVVTRMILQFQTHHITYLLQLLGYIKVWILHHPTHERICIGNSRDPLRSLVLISKLHDINRYAKVDAELHRSENNTVVNAYDLKT
ncbi:hypothetical protein MKW98_009279 [Papaver atlanticum]|uniref:Uncharacterized protein n=1 Tax=Papaver atlanticum TaxID=357466 RepID=A0AAD4XQV2_9MAGN|nr:hypothetical protein MKW98_009279 [Papaver atlanticum]